MSNWQACDTVTYHVVYFRNTQLQYKLSETPISRHCLRCRSCDRQFYCSCLKPVHLSSHRRLSIPNPQQFLVPGSSRIKDALGDTIPPAPPVLHSLFNLVPADTHFPKIFLDDIFPVLSRSTWPPPETLGFPCESLSPKSMVIHS